MWATDLGCVEDVVEARRDGMDGAGREGKRKEPSNNAEC